LTSNSQDGRLIRVNANGEFIVKNVTKTAVVVLAGFLGACSAEMQELGRTGIQSGAQLEDVGSRSAFFSSKSGSVSRSAATVTTQLRRLAAECINGLSSATTLTRGIGVGGSSQSFVRNYQARVTNEDGFNRMVVFIQNTGRLDGTAPFTAIVSTKVTPQADGTTMLTTTYAVSGDEFHDAAMTWAAGSETGCPAFL
jgi:hypothetical protein